MYMCYECFFVLLIFGDEFGDEMMFLNVLDIFVIMGY